MAQERDMSPKTIQLLQYASLTWIWIFVLCVDGWIISLLIVAKRLHDAINASVAIGIIAIPLFLMIASALTYVFFGLQKHRRVDEAGRRNF